MKQKANTLRMIDLKDARAYETFKLLMSLLQIACCMRLLNTLILISETICVIYSLKKKTNLYIPKWKSLYFSRSSQIAKRGVKDPSLHYPQGKHPGLITAAILDFTEHSSCTGSVNSYLPV